ncbi:MAG TPA: GAF domain-containing sensor histidine kinase [Atribacteraceae bacterium]|nr:GAF domain-containing sensor histidine kinase [Atribacteraceae bacterium]
MGNSETSADLLNYYCLREGLRKKGEYTACPLAVLSRVSAAISGLSNLEAILRIGLDTTLEFMNGAVGGIMLLDEETNMLCYHVYRGLSDTYAEHMCIRLGEGIAGKVAESGKAILVNDISRDPGAARPHLISTEGLKAFVSVPLQAKERVLGVMNYGSRTERLFTEADTHLLHSIGDQLGIAIERAKLYEQLKKGRERYRQLARQVILAQEEERKRIGRELHDETSQTLAGLALNLQALIELAEMIGIQNEQFKTMLRKTHAATVGVNIEVSRLIADLRPALLDILGLVPAIRQYAETSLTSLGIRVSFELDELKRILQPEEELTLFRWVQGAVGNIIQHAQAKNVTLSLKKVDGNLVLQVIDDGKGFNMSQVSDGGDKGRGYGLSNMRERMDLIGAMSTVQSEPGKGTTVTAVIPLGERWGSGK